MERGYTLSEAYALWRERADDVAAGDRVGQLDGDDDAASSAGGQPVLATASGVPSRTS
jgi:hypothetical protein